MAGILLEGNQVTAEARAAHARALAAEKRAASMRRAAELKARVGAQKLGLALRLPGTVLNDQIIAPGPFSRRLRAGDHLRIIDLEGQQAVDFLVYDPRNPENRYNAANTLKINRSVYLGRGSRLISDLGEVLMTVVDDTVGHHDTLGGCCSTEINALRYGIDDTASCRRNFIAALAEHGLQARDIPANINFFMNVPVRPDGSTEIAEGLSEPGDFVDLRADVDVLVVISNCPQLYNPCSGWNPTPVRLIEWRP
jgi:urea carboxylase-associated protein 1